MVKTIILKLLFLCILSSILVVSMEWVLMSYYAPKTANVAVKQFNDSNEAYQELRESEITKNALTRVSEGLLVLAIAILLFRKELVMLMDKLKNKLWSVPLLLVCCILVSAGGCRKEYDKPEYKEVGPNETGFLVPLEGDTSTQAKFDSLDKLKAQKVATKRIQITHRWNQTGRWETDGEWIPNVRLITIDRSPVTREWTASTTTGTSTKNEALWAESKDSVGFSTGINTTGMVAEEDAATFLYRFAGRTVAQVMDTEVRGRIQAALADFSAQYDMSELRGKKVEMITAIRKDVIAFFKEWGLTITNIGQFGGFEYENKDIQKGIDAVFIAQREKEVAAALLDAQRDKNLRITQEADALAQKETKIAEGIANGKKKILEVAKMAAQDPVFLELRRLEVEEARIAKWNGQYPYMLLSAGGQMPTMLMNMPTPPAQGK